MNLFCLHISNCDWIRLHRVHGTKEVPRFNPFLLFQFLHMHLGVVVFNFLHLNIWTKTFLQVNPIIFKRASHISVSCMHILRSLREATTVALHCEFEVMAIQVEFDWVVSSYWFDTVSILFFIWAWNNKVITIVVIWQGVLDIRRVILPLVNS